MLGLGLVPGSLGVLGAGAQCPLAQISTPVMFYPAGRVTLTLGPAK